MIVMVVIVSLIRYLEARAALSSVSCGISHTLKLPNIAKWILPNMISAVPALIIFGKMHFLLISENEFFMK